MPRIAFISSGIRPHLDRRLVTFTYEQSVVVPAVNPLIDCGATECFTSRMTLADLSGVPVEDNTQELEYLSHLEADQLGEILGNYLGFFRIVGTRTSISGRVIGGLQLPAVAVSVDSTPVGNIDLGVTPLH